MAKPTIQSLTRRGAVVVRNGGPDSLVSFVIDIDRRTDAWLEIERARRGLRSRRAAVREIFNECQANAGNGRK